MADLVESVSKVLVVINDRQEQMLQIMLDGRPSPKRSSEK